MNSKMTALYNFSDSLNEYLISVFSMRVIGLMENYTRSSWVRILRESRFGQVPSYTASQLDGMPHAEPCTTLIYRNAAEIQIVIADSMGVTFKRLDTLTPQQLERVRQILNCNFMAASVQPNEKQQVQREYIISYLEKLSDALNFFIA